MGKNLSVCWQTAACSWRPGPFEGKSYRKRVRKFSVGWCFTFTVDDIVRTDDIDAPMLSREETPKNPLGTQWHRFQTTAATVRRRLGPQWPSPTDASHHWCWPFFTAG